MRAIMNNINKNTGFELQDLMDSGSFDPILYQYYNNLENRVLIINSIINQDIIELAVLPLLKMDNDGTNNPIEIILSTAGGNVYDGFILANVIERLKTPTTITVLSMACSMGAYIIMSAFNNNNVKVRCYPFSIGLIHSGSQMIQGTGTQVKDTFKFNEKYEEKIKAYVLSHSYISDELYEKIDRQEFYMDSNDMLKYGLVDEIIQ